MYEKQASMRSISLSRIISSVGRFRSSRSKRPRPIALGLALAVLSVGCGSDKPAAVEEAKTALDQAQAGIDQAAASIAVMRKQSEELQQKIQQQRSALDSLIEKRLVLLRQQLDEYQKRVQLLPAAKETELKATLDDLNQRLNGVENNLRAYRDAPPEKPAEARQQLENSLKELDSAFQKLEDQLQPAKLESTAG
jgi:chromosome segregation ATPase